MNNVVFFVSGLGNGGLENYLLRFIRFKHRDFARIIIFCKSGKEGFLESQFALIPNVEIVKKKIGYLSILDFFSLYSFFRRNNIQIACDFTGNFGAFPLMIALFAGVKRRVSFFRKDTNIFPETKFKLFYNYWVNKLLPKVSTYVLSNSISAFNFFFKNKWKNNKKFEVIYNGIDVNQFLSTKDNLREELAIPKDAFVIGHVGRYNKAKNHKTVVKVATEVCRRASNTYFIICGNETDSNLRDSFMEDDLHKKVKLLGQRDDVIKVLNSLNCFYFPSFSEGQPNALIEALVVGIPFVASNIEPNKETIPKNLHGQLIPPEDVEGAVSKILEIRNSAALRESLNIQEWTKSHYDPNILFEKFYQKLTI